MSPIPVQLEAVAEQPSVRRSPLATPITPDEQRQLAQSALRQAITDALGTVDDVELRVVAVVPGRVLVQVACALDAELVVLATRKEGTPARLLGAVSQFVLRNAPCPALVVPEASTDL